LEDCEDWLNEEMDRLESRKALLLKRNLSRMTEAQKTDTLEETKRMEDYIKKTEALMKSCPTR